MQKAQTTKESWTHLILLVRYHDESKDMCSERSIFRYLKKKILLQIGNRQTNKKLSKDFISLFTNGISNGKDVRPKDEGKAVKAPQLPLLPVSSVVMTPLQLPAQALTLQKPGDHPAGIEKGMDK